MTSKVEATIENWNKVDLGEDEDLEFPRDFFYGGEEGQTNRVLVDLKDNPMWQEMFDVESLLDTKASITTPRGTREEQQAFLNGIFTGETI